MGNGTHVYVDVMLLFVDDFNLFLDVYHVRGCLHKLMCDFFVTQTLMSAEASS